MINAASVVSRIRINVIQTVFYLWDVPSSSSASSVSLAESRSPAFPHISLVIVVFLLPFRLIRSKNLWLLSIVMIMLSCHATSVYGLTMSNDSNQMESCIVCLCIARHFFDAFIVRIKEKSTASHRNTFFMCGPFMRREHKRHTRHNDIVH